LLLLSCIALALSPWSLAFKAVFPMTSLKLILIKYVFVTGFAKLEER
jgi:hypothetical protein